MEKIKITREKYKRIYSIACSSWKEKLKNNYYNVFSSGFEDEGLLTKSEVDEMLNASTEPQRKILSEIFKEYLSSIDKNPVKRGLIKGSTVRDLSVLLFGNDNGLQTLYACTPDDRPELEERALWVSDDYIVNVIPANINGSVIEFIRK